MIWESAVLNRIYKTSKFKLTIPNYSTMAGNTIELFKEKLTNFINKYGLTKTNINDDSLYDLNIHTNSNSVLYNLKRNNHTDYFSYHTNLFFFFYNTFFSIGKTHFITQIEENYTNVSINYNKLENLLIRLLFIKQLNLPLFKSEILKNFSPHFKYNNFILRQFSYYDVILFSLVFNTPLYYQNYTKDQDVYFFRWLKYTIKYLDFSESKMKDYYKLREKDALFEEYKMNSSSQLVTAVIKKQYPLIVDLIETKHENVNSRRPKDFKTLLHLACSTADRKCIDILVKNGCDIEPLDIENMTPLYDAIYSQDISFIKFFLKTFKVNLHHREIQNRTPFYWAACSGSIETIKYLLQKTNIDINLPSSMGRTALSKACWLGRDEVVELLCELKEIEVNFPDKNGRYPIHNAVWGEYGGRKGKKMSYGNTNDSPNSVMILIKHNADIEVKDNDGNTPFMISMSTNGIESMKILINEGAMLNKRNKKGETAITQAVQYGNWETVQCIIEMVKEGKISIDFDIKDNEGFRAIDHAVMYDRVICLKQLFELNESYHNVEEIANLCILSVEARSNLCFEYLIEQLKKEEMDDKVLKLSKDIAIKSIMFGNVKSFNYLFKYIGKDLGKYCEEKQDWPMILFGCELVKDKKDIIEEGKEEEESDEEDKISFEEKDKIFSHMIKIKMSEVEEKHVKYFGYDEDSNESDNKYKDIYTFVNNINQIISDIVDLIKKEKYNINENLIKILVDYSYTSEFNKLLLEESQNIIKGENINIDKVFYDKVEVEKHKVNKAIMNNRDKWETLQFTFNSNNALSYAIYNQDILFFQKLIKYNYIKEEIFSTVPLTNKNILHFLFEQDEFDAKFDSIIKIVETEYTNDIIKAFISKIDEVDINFVTPLDLLLKSENYELIEKYTTILYNFQFTHLHNNNNNKTNLTTFYTIKTFTIHQEEKTLDKKKKDYIQSRLVECQNFIQTKKKEIKNVTFDEINSISKYIINNNTIANILKIIELFKNYSLLKEFNISNPNYNFKFIDTEKDLIEICESISKNESVIGIDAEFSGDKCEIDGIVCLIQISTMFNTYAIDCLNMRSEITKHLKPIFENDNILKVYHGCDNDIFWILSNFDILSLNIYDTSRAFLIFREEITGKRLKKNSNLPSLYYLVNVFLNVKLDKSYQKSNWKIRPFTKNMLQYALNDAKTVLYLYYVFQGLYMYLNRIKICQSEEEENQCNLIYSKIESKFYEINEQNSKKISVNENKLINVKIAYICSEIIKKRMKDKYIKLNIN